MRVPAAHRTLSPAPSRQPDRARDTSARPAWTALWTLALVLAGSAGAGGALAAPHPFSPLPPMRQQPLLAQAEQAPAPPPPQAGTEQAGQPDQPSGDQDRTPSKPPLALTPVPVARQQAEQVAAPAANPATYSATGECRTDAQCPAQAACVDGFCKSKAQRTSALFYFHQPGPIGYRVVLPFYFSFWRPQVSTKVVAPLFITHENRHEGTKDLVLPLLLYQHHREPGVDSHRVWPLLFYSDYGKDGSAFGLLPLMYAARRGDRTSVVVPPLLTFYRGDRQSRTWQFLGLGVAYGQRKGDHAFFAAVPLLTYYREHPGLRELLLLGGLGFARKTSEYELAIVLGLGIYYRDKTDTVAMVFPLAWHKATEDRSTTVVLPLYFAGEDRHKGTRNATLFPFFHYERDDQTKERLWVSLIGGRYVDGTSGVSTTALLVPPLLHRDTPRRTLTLLPPVAGWWKDKQSGHQAGYAGPAFWSVDETGSTAGLFPLYFRFHDADAAATTHVVLPIAVLHTSPTRFFGYLGPLYGYRRNNGTDAPVSGGGLLPLIMVGQGRASYVFIAPPVFSYYHNRDTGLHHLAIGPFFYRTHQTGAPSEGPKWDAGLAPLFFIGQRRDARYQVLLPLFYHFKDRHGEQLILGPIFYDRALPRQQDDPAASVTAGVFPLLFLRLSRASSFAVVPPLFWYARHGDTSVAVLGPAFFRREPGRVTAGVFPLLYYRHDATERTLLSPLVLYHENRDHRLLAVGPYIDIRRAESTTRAVLPLAFFYRGKDRSADVIFPLFLQSKEGGTTVRSVALLYWGVWGQDLRAHILAPLAGYVRTSRSTTVVLGPLFFHRRHAGEVPALGVGLLPLFGYGQNERRTVLATPIGFYYRNKQDDHVRSYFLLYYADLRKERSDWGVLPLLFARRRGTAVQAVAPLLLFYHSHDSAEDRSMTVAGPLYYSRHTGEKSFGLLPLLFGHTESNGSYWAAMVPLFLLSHREGKDPLTRFFTPIAGYSRDRGGFAAYLGPAYLRRDREFSSEALLPIFYHSRDLLQQRTTWLLFPLFLQRQTPQTTLTAITPLFWQYSTLTRSVVLAFPLVLDVLNRFHSRLTAVGPLVIRARNYAENTTTWVFPPLLTYVQKNADGYHDAAMFPLLWHFGSAERSTTVVLPLFYRLRRPGYTATVLFPLFGHLRDGEGSSWMIPPLLAYGHTSSDGETGSGYLFPLFWHSRELSRETTVAFPLYGYVRRPQYRASVFVPIGAHWSNAKGAYTVVLNLYIYRGGGLRKGAWDMHFWPLFAVGHPRRSDLEWSVLEGLVGYSRLGLSRRLRLLWGISIPLAPAGQPVSRPVAQ